MAIAKFSDDKKLEHEELDVFMHMRFFKQQNVAEELTNYIWLVLLTINKSSVYILPWPILI